MPRNTNNFLSRPPQPSGGLQRLADELLKMPYADHTDMQGLLHSLSTEKEAIQSTNDDLRMSYGRIDICERAQEFLDGLKRAKAEGDINIDKPLYPNDPAYKMTIRDALHQGTDILAALIHFEEMYKAMGKDNASTPDILAKAIKDRMKPDLDPTDINTLDIIRSDGAADYRKGNYALKTLDAINTKFRDVLAILPPERMTGK